MQQFKATIYLEVKNMAIEQNISFLSDGLVLSGTVTLPDLQGTYPSVVLVPGSGEVDRNENAKKLAINAFREIAAVLATKEIASLRYDKRGVGQSQGDFWKTGFYDNIKDASSAVDFIKHHAHIDPEQIFVLGHSEGAAIATRLAATGTNIKGLILLAGTAQSGEDVLLWQGEQVTKSMHGLNGFLIHKLHINVRKAQEKQFEKIKHSTKDWFRMQLITKINAKWMREFLAYNPAKDLPKIQIPVLAITGSKDIQVDPADLKKMAELVKSNFNWFEVPDITHILRKETGEPTLSTYQEQIQKPVDKTVLNIVSDWLEDQIEMVQPEYAAQS